MGQLALGFRSLLIKLAVFFVMAGLLAWSLGGHLFPKPTITIISNSDGMYWQIQTGRDIEGLNWNLVKDNQVVKSGNWQTVAGPAVIDGVAWVATSNSGNWSFFKINEFAAEEVAVPPSKAFSLLFPASDK